MRGYRVALRAKIDAKAPPATIMDYYQTRLVGRPQFGPWQSFYPMIEGLTKVGPPSDQLIVLGGWLRPPPTTLTGLLPVAADLQKAVWDFGVYYQAPPSSSPAFPDWVRSHPDQYAAGRARDLVELKRSIHHHLTFMAEQALVFSSTPADPGQAWRDFGRFCEGYNQVMGFLPTDFAEYYLLIAPPPSAGPLAPAVPAAPASPVVTPAVPTVSPEIAPQKPA